MVAATSELGPLVGADWLAQYADEVVVADVRAYLDGRNGRDAYESGHLPGAVFVELATVLSDPPSPARGRHPLPDPERFAAELGALGIGDDDVVIAYDDAGGAMAARLVWMLRAIGQPAALLDGGIAAWDGPLERSTPPRPPVRRVPRPWPPDALADLDEIAAIAAATSSTLLLDARAPERFRGEVEPLDARAGHIPGARNVPSAGNLGPDGRFLSAAALAARLDAALAGTPTEEAIVYCGSGVTAAHLVLAAAHAGRPLPRLYAGSWSEWITDPTRGVATGP